MNRNSAQLPTNRNSTLDNIKTFAILLVVLGHVCVFYAGLGVIDFPIHSFILRLAYFIYAFHMPLFFFLSGMIYGICIQNGKYRNAPAFVKKKAQRLLVPYLFWGLAAVAPVMHLLHFTDESFLHYCVHGILLGENNRHLWYLISLFTMFLITDAIRRQKIKTPGRIFFLILATGASLLYTHGSSFFNIKATMRCFVFFLSGMYAIRLSSYRKHENTEKRKRTHTIVALITASACFLFLWFWSGRTDFDPPWLRLAAGFAGIAMTFSASPLVPGNPGRRECRWLRLIRTNSFGIYLAHPMLIYCIMYFCRESRLTLSPLLIVPAVTAVTLLLSVLITECIRKVHAGMLIGEPPVHTYNGRK